LGPGAKTRNHARKFFQRGGDSDQLVTATASNPRDIEPAAQVASIELRGVVKRYGSQTALSGIDLEIRDGEFFCLLGPSGCGKTTTLNLIGGFVGPTEGEIWIRGRRIDLLPPHKRPVNTVFQSYALFPHMTVRENVRFGLKMDHVGRAESSERAEAVLALVGLEGFGDRMPSQLSGGQQQRVAVARALVKRPAVLLLDEPLGALDLKLRQQLQIELSRIHRDVGTTFVYVTHDQEEAMSMADQIAVMNDGRIEQVGTAEEIYRRPVSRFVADFIGDSNFFAANVDGDVALLADGSRVPCAGGSGPATLMVRPASIRITQGHGPLRGTVVHTSFLGTSVRVAVETKASENPVVVALHDTSAVPSVADEVALVWAAAEGLVLEADP
jgi:spermidine/putrescine transport system ATP-binding protein